MSELVATPEPANRSDQGLQDLLDQSNAQRAVANTFFRDLDFSQAIGEYDKALSLCPSDCEYERAVLKSNVAACHLKLADWKAAIDSATQSLEALDRLDPGVPGQDQEREDSEPVEIKDDEEEAQTLAKLQDDDQKRADIQRIRVKALLRRAKARSEKGGWGNLQGAEEGAAAAVPHFGIIGSRIDHRLQTTGEHARTAHVRTKGGQSSVDRTSTASYRSQGAGNGRNDGQTQRSKLAATSRRSLPVYSSTCSLEMVS